MLSEHITSNSYITEPREKKTNTITKIAIGIVIIAIVVGGVFAGTYFASQSPPSTTPTPTLTPTSSPTSNPTATSTPTVSSSPRATGTATSTPTVTSYPTATPQPQSLTGAGASFPWPLLNAWITYYTTSVKPGMQINYQSIGSGGGISAMAAKTVDFGASDAPLSASEQVNVPNALHIPETIGAVTIVYNLPSISSNIRLNLTGQIIADIYMGTITNWNDAAIQAINPTLTLPNQPIKTVHRSDSSGTTFVFTSYLCAVSSSWKTAVGQGKSVSWPNAPGGVIGSNNNAGVASTVNGTAYSIGYVELAYALQNGMTIAAVRNPAGNFVVPSLATTTAAAQSVASSGLPAGNESWVNVNLLNAPDATAYPIVSFSYLLVYKELNVLPEMTQAKATALVQFLWWAIHDGQNLASAQAYAPLPSNVVTINENTIRSITFNGQTLSVT